MRPTRWLLLIGLLVLPAACAEPDPPAPVVTREIDAAGVEVVTSTAPAWTEADRWTVSPEPAVQIGLETGPAEYMLSNVGGAVRLADGRIVVADGDALELRVYDEEGRYLTSIGGEGPGPGEFGYLYGVLECVPDEIWALVLPQAFSRFHLDGEFIGLLRLDLAEGGGYYNQACNAAGQHLVIGWGTPRLGRGLFRTASRASLVSADSELIADLGEVHTSERWGTEGGTGPHDYGKQTVLALDTERALIGEADDFEIREYDLGGTLVRRTRWQGTELALTPGEIERYKAWVTETNQLGPDSPWTQQLIIMEFPETMPAYSAMQLDDTGHLWVRRFNRPGIRAEDWDVFAPDGTWLGTVAAPLGLEITEIGAEYILGIFQDELGTEFVRLHRLSRGGS